MAENVRISLACSFFANIMN